MLSDAVTFLLPAACASTAPSSAPESEAPASASSSSSSSTLPPASSLSLLAEADALFAVAAKEAQAKEAATAARAEAQVALLSRAHSLLANFRPTPAAERYSEPARRLERSRAALDHEAALLAAELQLSALGSGGAACGHDRHGLRVFAFGGAATELWVEAPSSPSAPAEMRAIATDSGLAALLGGLDGLDEREAPLRDTLARRRPQLVAAMHAATRDDARRARAELAAGSVAVTAAASATCSACAFCGAATGRTDVAHCVICHGDFVVGAALTLEASRSAFVQHARSCWEAHSASPEVLAIAGLCAGAGTCVGADSGPATRSVGAVVTALGACPSALTAALDPRLLRLKRALIATAGAVDWRQLRSPASWPPGARAAWALETLRARSFRELLERGFARLEAALRADDAQPATDAPQTLLVAVKSQRGSASQSFARSSAPASATEAWLSPQFIEGTPTAAAAAAVPTAAALALRLRCLAGSLLRRGRAPEEVVSA